VQTGHLYWYALVMLLGVFGLLTWQLWPTLSGVFGR
jgi:NADH-quinone oxidoreductase subunit L